MHQDHLTGTSLMTDTNGDSQGTIKYYPYGECRNSQPEIENFPTDRLFTGQRYDETGLYYYGVRYYDPVIGRFISPDTIIPYPANPQSFNRYSYCLNNPLKYIDPSGHAVTINGSDVRYFEDYVNNPEYMSIFGTAEELDATIHSEEYQTYNEFSDLFVEQAAKLEESETVYEVEVDLPVSINSGSDSIIFHHGSNTQRYNWNVGTEDITYIEPTPDPNVKFFRNIPRYMSDAFQTLAYWLEGAGLAFGQVPEEYVAFGLAALGITNPWLLVGGVISYYLFFDLAPGTLEWLGDVLD